MYGKTLKTATDYLKNKSKKDCLCKEASLTYSKHGHYKKMDINDPYIFAFDNIAFDVRTGKEIKPKIIDYITMTTGYDYVIASDEVRNDINNILKDIFPEKEDLISLLVMLSTTLTALNKDEKAYFWLGVGANGKGLLTQLLDLCLGNYVSSEKFDFMLKQASDTAKPDVSMFDLLNKRALIITEANDSTKVDCSKFKRITGGD